MRGARQHLAGEVGAGHGLADAGASDRHCFSRVACARELARPAKMSEGQPDENYGSHQDGCGDCRTEKQHHDKPERTFRQAESRTRGPEVPGGRAQLARRCREEEPVEHCPRSGGYRNCQHQQEPSGPCPYPLGGARSWRGHVTTDAASVMLNIRHHLAAKS